MMDALSRLALVRAEAAAADVEAQLSMSGGERPVLVMLQMAKQEAALAIAALVNVDADDPKKIRRLQNEVLRFIDLCRWIGDVLAAGSEAAQQISDEDRNELIEILSQTTEGQEQLVNLGLLNGDTYAQ
jgi:hypothetical protein